MKLLDIHGENAASSQVLVQIFIRECFELREYNVAISHGYGKGILKEVVNSELKKSKYVKNFELASPNYGGAGVTIVYIKSKKEYEDQKKRKIHSKHT